MTKFFTTALNTVSPSSSNKDRDVAFWARFGHCEMSDLSPFSGVKRKSDLQAVSSAFDHLERTSRCFGLGADIKNFAPELRSNKSSWAQRHRVLVGCAAASMRYHDEIRVFSRLMAKSVVGNNQ
jgi:hypothetical protein